MPKSSLSNEVRAARRGKLDEIGEGQQLSSDLELELARTRKELAKVQLSTKVMRY